MGPSHSRPASPACPTAIQPACRGGLQTHFRYAPARSCPGHCEAVGPNPKAREPGRGKPAGGAKAGLDSNSCGGKPYKSKPYKQAQHSRRLVELDVTVIPRRCIAGPQLKLYSCPTMHNYSRFRVLGTYAKQDTYFSVDFPSEIVACIGGIAFKRSGHGFRSPTVFPAAAVISPPLEPENWGHHNLLRSYMPRHNGKWEHSHREDPSVSAIHTVSILSPLWRKLLLHQFRPPPHASWQSPEKYSSFPAVKNRVR